MSERSLEATCPECGRPLSFHPSEVRPTRCDECFDGYLRAIDNDFLASYGELGVTSRRVVAETCLRGLVLDQPPARKVLAVAIMEQFLLASGDLIGLTGALKNRDREPIARPFLSFRLDGESAEAFFAELAESGETELLASLGLPAPEQVSTRYPGLEPDAARDLSAALTSLVSDLRETAERSGSALLLGELAGQVHGGPALTGNSSWLPQDGLRPDQVASLVLDERRRQLVVQAVSVDEDRLGEVVDAITRMTNASSNMILAYLTVQDEEERLAELTEGRS